MLCKIWCNTMLPLHGVLPVPYMPVPVTLDALVAHWHMLMRLLAAEARGTGGLYFPSQCLYGTLLVTLYSMAWDWRGLKAGSMPFYWPSCSLPFCLLLFSLSLFSFYVLVL